MPAAVGGWDNGRSGREEGWRRRSCDQLEMGQKGKRGCRVCYRAGVRMGALDLEERRQR